LASIAVTPANQSIAAGSNLQYTATGTYSDGSTQNLTNQVTWASSTAAATINSTGLAHAVSSGSPSISATSGSVVGSTSLTVTAGGTSATLSTSTLNFATLGTGSTVTAQQVTLTNSGTSALSITSIAPSNGDFAQANNCPTSLVAGASCQINVSFTPTTSG